ncbi:fibronectin type III domain-containing protein [Aquimarina brevivitae]|uniref:Putative secreted protein (Por secretion system target) n=1 Tax=Aquimarina brevivitae TaxID=323412 RepID=A0A4V2F5B1_9FLAO|nr:fibronectin type III domain-containing protein [Aquimarina brevivitae]RZS92199.1 putative secreted protein (Por secretion system target) [Aquimarina brevivitae]
MKTTFFYVACIAMLCCSLGSYAQKQGMKASSVGKAEYVRVIPAISKMDNIISAKGMMKDGQEKKRGRNTFVPGKGLPAAGQQDPLMQKQQKSQRAAISTEVANFQSHSGFSTPTDPTGAVGPNHYVYAFNTGFGIRDKSGNVIVPEASLATIFPGEDLGDPIVVYDNYADRFIIMQFSNTPNGFLIAVGQGPDPVNDGWFTYRFNTGSFPDYEKLSIWSDGYYITANKDQNNPSGNDVVFAVERDKMLVGDANAQFVGFPLPGARTSGFYSPGGSHSTGPTLPPVGTGHAFLYLQDDSWSGVSQDHIKVWTTDVDWTNPANSTISQPQEIITSPFDSVFDGGSFSNLPQPSGGDIDALQATMMYMTNYRRFGTHNSIILNFVVDLNGNDNLAGIRWYELRQTSDGQPWTIFQEGTYVQPDGLSAFCGSMAMDAQGNIGMAYTVVSNTTVPSIRYTGRLASDPLGTMTLAEQLGVNGTQSDPSTRYGDYGQMTIDPTDDATFWHTAEYFTGGSRRNHVVAFKIAPDTPDTEAPTPPTNLSASNTTDVSTSLSWDAASDNIGVTGYDVYQDGTVIATVTNTSLDVNGLTPDTSYDYFVIATDAAGNESAASNTITITTDAPDTQAPSAPTNLSASNTTANTTDLTWDAATDNIGVSEYRILQDGIVVNTTASTAVTITDLAPETTYSFTVVAVDAAGNISPASNVVSVTTLEASGCLNGVLAPYNESFESSIGLWTQSAEDDLDWTRDANGTPSRSTGPSSADDGNFYLYVEASGNGVGYPNKTAIINSPCFDLGGAAAATFSFSYHMFGASNFGSLAVEASNDEGASWTSIWQRSGNQGNFWQTASIDLSAYLGTGVQLRFVRITGGTWRADAAIDKIALTTGSDPGDDCASSDLTLTITLDNYPQETSWNITNSAGNIVASEGYSTANPDGSTIIETIDGLSSGDYTFTIFDSYGDGICCRYGIGSYTLSSANGTIVTGGEFGSSEATSFCVTADSARLETYELSDLDETELFKLYPNPAKNILNVTLGDLPIDQLEIFSMYGQLVKKSGNQGQNSQIDISDLPTGTYFVRFTAEEVIVTRSFVKE